MGVFLPISKHHRFIKSALSFEIAYIEITVRLNPCEEHKISEEVDKIWYVYREERN